ncbi:MAG: alpha/beta hydrolase [Planctomycetota bacterium]
MTRSTGQQKLTKAPDSGVAGAARAGGRIPLSRRKKWLGSIHHRHIRRTRPRFESVWTILVVTISIVSPGCCLNNEMALRRMAQLAQLGPGETIQVREVQPPGELNSITRFWASPEPLSERTQQVLRRYYLLDRYNSQPDEVIRWMHDICERSPDMEEVTALAEISLNQATWAVRNGDDSRATQLYATAVVHAWQFLFDPALNIQRNAYDPQFREICDVYNHALSELIRDICDADGMVAGATYTIGTGDLAIELKTEVQGRWRNSSFERFELAGDYETEGIENLYHTYGLGVPLIAVHHRNTDENVDQYYPPTLPLPMTAFLDVVDGSHNGQDAPIKTAVLKIYDPLETTNIVAHERVIPLESDITTPLAYSMQDPLLSTNVLATVSLLNPNKFDHVYGLYMLEPFDPDKIPVLLVHGLWSSPVTWIEMFNDLRADRELRENYQFWFYAYPTGQPFWITARELRDDLAALRQELDPGRQSESLREMVMVGHSMGGLVSRLQTIESGDRFWSIVSDEPFESLDGDAKALQAVRDTFFFEPDPDVARVITLASPAAGSDLANSAAKWLSHNFFTLPDIVTNDFERIARDNADLLDNRDLLTVTTSIDSLAPDSPFFEVMLDASAESDVPLHNIYGMIEDSKFSFGDSKPGDGVVDRDSATAAAAISEIEVEAEHAEVHRHPRSVLEVRRILLEHLVEAQRINDPRLPVIPTAATSEDTNRDVSHAHR